MTEPTLKSTPSPGWNRWMWLIVAGVALANFLPYLGTPGLWDEDEGFFAGAALEMHRNDAWIVPEFNEELFAHKPPFMYWMMRIGFFLFGENEWGARFFSAIFGTAAAILTMDLGRRLFSPFTGFFAGLAMASCIMWTVVSRAATPDGELAFWIAMAVWFYVRNRPPETWQAGALPLGNVSSLLPERWIDFVIMYGLMAIAVLVKGPIGVLLPGCTIGLFVILASSDAPADVSERTWSIWSGLRRIFSKALPVAFWKMRPFTAIMVVLLIAGPWYVAVDWYSDGGFSAEFFGEHHFERFNRPMENHSGSVLYYLPIGLAGFFPWSIFFGATLIYGLHQIYRQRSSAWLLLACWVLVVVGLFSFAGTKLPNYILPAFPAFAIATGRWLDVWIHRDETLWSNWIHLAYGSMVFVGLALAAGFWVITQVPIDGELLMTQFDMNLSMQSVGIPIALCGVVLVVGGAIAWWLCSQRSRSLFAFSIAAWVFVFCGFAIVPVLLDEHQFNQRAIATARDYNQKNSIAETGPMLATYRTFQPSLVYYAERRVEELRTPEALLEFIEDYSGRPILIDERRRNEIENELGLGVQIIEEMPRFPKPGKLFVARISELVVEQPAE